MESRDLVDCGECSTQGCIKGQCRKAVDPLGKMSGIMRVFHSLSDEDLNRVDDYVVACFKEKNGGMTEAEEAAVRQELRRKNGSRSVPTPPPVTSQKLMPPVEKETAKVYYVVSEYLWKKIGENLEQQFQDQPSLGECVRNVQPVKFPNSITLDRLYEGTPNQTCNEFAAALSDYYGIEK